MALRQAKDGKLLQKYSLSRSRRAQGLEKCKRIRDERAVSFPENFHDEPLKFIPG